MNNESLDCEVKKKYICENILKIVNHKHYLDIVEFHEAPHTTNSNGIFVNLNTLIPDVIDKLYYKLKNEIEDESFSINVIEKQIIEDEILELFKGNTKSSIREKYDIIKLDDFTENEKLIIGMSKKYKI
jgi:hypothetical protein|tara:strand:- start:840 stop:1226 length:387 start_codon:yes stop_codon:yes gene_type:complete